jgi:hypothetical protein
VRVVLVVVVIVRVRHAVVRVLVGVLRPRRDARVRMAVVPVVMGVLVLVGDGVVLVLMCVVLAHGTSPSCDPVPRSGGAHQYGRAMRSEERLCHRAAVA